MSTPASMFHLQILLGSIGFLPSAGARTSESGKGSEKNGTSAAAAASQRIKKPNLCQEAGDEDAGDEDAERRVSLLLQRRLDLSAVTSVKNKTKQSQKQNERENR